MIAAACPIASPVPRGSNGRCWRDADSLHIDHVGYVPQAEVKRHAITCATLNDIVQSQVDEVSDYRMVRSGASGIADVRWQRRNMSRRAG